MQPTPQNEKGNCAMREKLQPAIEALQQDLAELERKANETKTLINRLCEAAGMPAIYADVGVAGSAPTIASIRGDTFYGKSVTTAAREYLEMRKGANLGPASTRDIYEALKTGGFHFETADANNAMTGIRAVMRKNSSIFHKLPNGDWGLLAWYERVKAAKAASKEKSADDDVEITDEDREDQTETATARKAAAAS